MTNWETDMCRQYAQAAFNQLAEPLDPVPFSPNWSDQPSRFKIYQHVERFPLPGHLPSPGISLAGALQSMTSSQGEQSAFPLQQLEALLLLATGVLSRRLAINWNDGNRSLPTYSHAVYGRGTPSGGGLYPTEVYWAAGPGGSMLSGIYHYDVAHHALERLSIGDITQEIRAAVQHHPTVSTTDQFLIITINFWKNAFKYGSIGYHLGIMDMGALLCSLQVAALVLGADLPFLLWFADEALNRLLGLDTLAESTFAVVPLPCTPSTFPAAKDTPAPFRESNHSALYTSGTPSVKTGSFQRSKTVIRFPTIERVHQASLIDHERRPSSPQERQAHRKDIPTLGEPTPLPAPALERLQSDIVTIFRIRQSSFGGFSTHMPLSCTELATLLYAGAIAGSYPSDLTCAGAPAHFTQLGVFAVNVEDVEPGAYSYDRNQHCLWTIQRNDLSVFLQEHYGLRNYNMAAIGAVLVILGSPHWMLDTYGNRGYRALNTEVGLVAQSIYLTATALSIGCGAALGFDQSALTRALELDGSDLRMQLALLTGHERQNRASFDYRLV